MPRPITFFRLAALVFAFSVAGCGSRPSAGQPPLDAATDAPPDALPAATVDTADDVLPSGPEVGLDQSPSPDLPTTPDNARDLPEDRGLADTRDVADDPSPVDARDGVTAETLTRQSDLPPDSATESRSDVPDVSAPTVCAAGLSGTSPFGRALLGTATFSPSYGTGAPMTSTITAYIYFPAGRVAGAPVQLAVQSRVVTGQFFFGPQATLASDLAATGLSVGGHDLQITGNLLPGAGGLQATVGANFSSPGTDVADDRSAAMLMCPNGDVPAPALQILAATFSPLSTLALSSTTPITVEVINALRITSPLGPVAFKVSAEPNSRYSAGPNFTIAAASAFPTGQPLTFDASALKDVLGREVPVTISGPQILATSAVLADLSFSETPPAGAIACSGCSPSGFPGLDGGLPTGATKCTGGGTVAGGILKVASGGTYNGRFVDALLALPATSATKLRVRMAAGDVIDAGTTCESNGRYASAQTAVMAVVGPNGEASAPVGLTCDGTLADHVIDLPNASPLWLVVHLEGYTPMPFFLPVSGPPSVSIDELAFM